MVYKPNNRLLRKNNKFTLLHTAVRCNLENIVEATLKVKRINIDVEDYHGWTSLHWAACYGHIGLVKL
ncbi:MAG: ankyrin repeat domain-containing protein [Wolbachia sp.]